MRARELAHLLGLGRRYYEAYWARDLPIYRTPEAVQDASGALFVHIPKTAGVSVCRAIYGTDQLFGHAPASGWRHHDRARFDRLLSFALMRDPTDRFFSAFYYLRDAPLTQKDRDFGRRVLGPFDTPDALLRAMARSRALRARVMSWVHFTPQSWYLTERSGAVIVDVIGRVERFEQSMSDIAQRLGRPYSPTHSNASRRPRALALSPEARAVLTNLYDADFRLYRSRFGESA